MPPFFHRLSRGGEMSDSSDEEGSGEEEPTSGVGAFVFADGSRYGACRVLLTPASP